MIERIVGGSVARRGLVLGLAAGLIMILAGVASRLSFDALPDITSNQVLVLTRAPGLTPEEIERLVTRPVEVALGGVPGLVSQRSISHPGLSAVTAIFSDKVDPYRARQLAAERLAGVSVPEGVEHPELGPLSGGLGEIFQFTISSPSRTPAELLELAELRLAPLLRAVPGVVEVNTWGGEVRTLSVEADPARLAARGLSLSELKEGLANASGSAAGASVPAGGGQALLRGVARPADPSALGAAVVRADPSGEVVRVSDVANVSWGGLPRLGAATADGQGELVYAMALMLRDENALDVMGRIHSVLPDLRRAAPDDVRIKLVYDRSHLVGATLKTVGKNLLEGGLLVIVVLFAMLGSLRAGLLVASAIPFSMLFAAAGMVMLGIPGNLMSLGAIDFGLVVDGAVVMVEAIFHALDPRRNPALASLNHDAEARRRHVAGVARSVARPVFFSVMVILLVYLPVISLTGVDGKMFRPMALTMVFALAGSLIYALTVIPALSSWLLRPKDVPSRDPLLVRAVDALYARALPRATRRPFAVAAAGGAMLVAGALAFSALGTEFVPQLDEGDLVIQTTRAPDTSIESAVRDAGRLERVLRAAAPEVLQVASRIGSPAVATDTMGLDQADVFVHLAPKKEWRKGLTRDRLIEELEEAIQRDDPGGDFAFTQPIQMRFNELVGGEVTDVSLSLFGTELGELRALAEKVRDAIATVPGAADVRVMTPPDVPLLEVEPNPLAAARAGLTASEILDAVRAIRVGIPVGTTWVGAVEVPIVLRLGSGTTAFGLGELPVVGPGGRLVPLSRVAEVRTLSTPSLISHDDAQRRVVIGLNVRGASLGAVADDAKRVAEPILGGASGIRWAWGGQVENLRAANERLMLVIPLVLATIFLLLVAAFHRVRPAAILLVQIPFATVGGVGSLWIRDMPLSISAVIGFIALSGIAVLNGVVLMHRLLHDEDEGMSPVEAATEAALSRARPVLMTALVAALGFVPMMLATGIGAEVQRPLATVVVGGLFTSTLLTLFVLPVLYPRLAGRGRRGQAFAG
ncbi:efflux RND transporter permease subunit [Vulgatibacter incomptus]|uniref:Cobalt-zinc-cadmium resistance protein CzcA n=1 Tax=Vulgatibacter incomptus TaxID=1391653 RepID=A0A0K1PGE1_9BACT|nr:CusA/CzcA family heavy metal efflux RND transporter [Vulgatibacter incomptus]AKU92486.1 Cobalt-zinc-cadmium resistance protein CzcA [Vulgatibacter incomptus]